MKHQRKKNYKHFKICNENFKCDKCGKKYIDKDSSYSQLIEKTGIASVICDCNNKIQITFDIYANIITLNSNKRELII